MVMMVVVMGVVTVVRVMAVTEVVVRVLVLVVRMLRWRSPCDLLAIGLGISGLVVVVVC